MSIFRKWTALALVLVAFTASAAREGFVFKGRVDFLEPNKEYDAEFLFYSGTADTSGTADDSPGYGRKARIKTDASRNVNCLVTDALAEMDNPPTGNAYWTNYAEYLLPGVQAGGGMMVELRVDMGDGTKKTTQRQRVTPVPFASRVLASQYCTGDFTATDGTLTFKTVNCSRLNVASTGSVLGSLRCAGSASLDGDVSVHSKLALGGGNTIVADGPVKVEGTKSRLAYLNELPVGSIIAWTDPDLPSGDAWTGVWAICDGTQHTPDLRDRFIIGVGEYKETIDGTSCSYTYRENDVGGAKTVVIDESTYPRHKHTFNLRFPKTTTYGMNDFATKNHGVWGGGTSNYSTTTDSWTGGSDAHENLPPFYRVIFIQRIR